MPPVKLPAERLKEVLDRDCPEEEVGRVLRDCLVATSRNRAGVTEPDWKVRLAAATFVTSYRHGLPIRREELVTVAVDADSAVGMEERMKNSPALRAMFQAMLDRVEGAIDV